MNFLEFSTKTKSEIIIISIEDRIFFLKYSSSYMPVSKFEVLLSYLTQYMHTHISVLTNKSEKKIKLTTILNRQLSSTDERGEEHH